MHSRRRRSLRLWQEVGARPCLRAAPPQQVKCALRTQRSHTQTNSPRPACVLQSSPPFTLRCLVCIRLSCSAEQRESAAELALCRERAVGMASLSSNPTIAARQRRNEELRLRFLDAKERAIGVRVAGGDISQRQARMNRLAPPVTWHRRTTRRCKSKLQRRKHGHAPRKSRTRHMVRQHGRELLAGRFTRVSSPSRSGTCGQTARPGP